MKYRSGYEQGKSEGAWVGEQLKDADKIRKELNKQVIPQFVADVIEGAREQSPELEAQNDFLKGLCNNQLEIIMDYEWKQMQEQAAFIKANTRKWRAR